MLLHKKFLIIHDSHYLLTSLIGKGRTATVCQANLIPIIIFNQSNLFKKYPPSNQQIFTIRNSIFQKQTNEEQKEMQIGNKLSKEQFNQTNIDPMVERQIKISYAIKIIQFNNKNQQINKRLKHEILTQIWILTRLQHHSIIKLFNFGHSKDGRFVAIIQQNGVKGNLIELMHKVNENQELRRKRKKIYVHVLAQVLSCLCQLQKQGILHRDLKAENIVFDEQYRVRLIDFGSAQVLPHSPLHATALSNPCFSLLYQQILSSLGSTQIKEIIIGSPHYISPEMIDKNCSFNPDKDCSKTDIWSFGVLAFKLFTNEFPFNGHNNFYLFQSIRKANVDLSKIQDVNVKQLIATTLVPKQQRNNLENIKKLPLFRNIDFNLIAEQPSPIINQVEKKYLNYKKWSSKMTVRDSNLKVRKIKVYIKQEKNFQKIAFEMCPSISVSFPCIQNYVCIRVEKVSRQKVWQQRLNNIKIERQEKECILRDLKGKQLFSFTQTKQVLNSFFQACNQAQSYLNLK